MNRYYTLVIFCFFHALLPMRYEGKNRTIFMQACQTNDIELLNTSLKHLLKGIRPSFAAHIDPAVFICPLHTMMQDLVDTPQAKPELLETFFAILQQHKELLGDGSFYLYEALLNNYSYVEKKYYSNPNVTLHSWLGLILLEDRIDLLPKALEFTQSLYAANETLQQEFQEKIAKHCLMARSKPAMEQLLQAGTLTLRSLRSLLGAYPFGSNRYEFSHPEALLCLSQIFGAQATSQSFNIERESLARTVVTHGTQEVVRHFIEQGGANGINLVDDAFCEHIQKLGVEFVYDQVGAQNLLFLLRRCRYAFDILQEFINIPRLVETNEQSGVQHIAFQNADLVSHIQQYGALWLCWAAACNDQRTWDLLLQAGANPEEGEYLACKICNWSEVKKSYKTFGPIPIPSLGGEYMVFWEDQFFKDLMSSKNKLPPQVIEYLQMPYSQRLIGEIYEPLAKYYYMTYFSQYKPNLFACSMM